ncbi:hypothetical protein D9619_004271 [Psilocybe cf. subviscida]|uniref:Cytochrome P450 n=1 Tax=Psilocybe cf. subviscida TaxID=2480587 RepID=A0A8H5F7M8_9AGAR|nr:hypothetical protein D9619_004271 [Psilocybe cf. subviscida]
MGLPRGAEKKVWVSNFAFSPGEGCTFETFDRPVWYIFHPMSSISVSCGLALVAGAWAIFSIFRAQLLRLKMPPGPPGIPFVGNIFQVPNKLSWLRFSEFAREYGPVISFVAMGQPVVVLHDHKSAYELLERRSAAYSHRPAFIMAGELLCGGIMLPMINSGSLFRRMKRSTHATFNPRAAERFKPLQEGEAIRLTSDLLENSLEWDHIIQSSTSSSILTAIYAWPRLTEEHHPIVQRIHDHLERVSKACIPGSSMVDIFPAINRLPLWMSKWKRDALKWHERETTMFEGFYREVEDKMVEGKAFESFTRSLIETKAVNELSVKEASWLSGIMFSAGAETTIASMKCFLIAMIHYPHVMRKAQAELDRVVGRDRLPSFMDKEHLPYIRAIVKELLRWRPPAPLGIPRRLTEDDWYDGYFIPKGTTVISNIWAINRDPSIYNNPEEFIPERHLDDEGVNDVSPPEMHSLGHSTFGFGRRSCVGMSFASQTLFINFALLLWAFDIDRARDADGEETMPSLTDFVDHGISVGPAPFHCSLVPRHPDVAIVVGRSLA